MSMTAIHRSLSEFLKLHSWKESISGDYRTYTTQEIPGMTIRVNLDQSAFAQMDNITKAQIAFLMSFYGVTEEDIIYEGTWLTKMQNRTAEIAYKIFPLEEKLLDLKRELGAIEKQMQDYYLKLFSKKAKLRLKDDYVLDARHVEPMYLARIEIQRINGITSVPIAILKMCDGEEHRVLASDVIFWDKKNLPKLHPQASRAEEAG